jgi:large subunit ribosomal protein L32e
MIMTTRKKKPKFNVLNLGFFGRVKSRWRKPRGTHNKKRMKAKWTGASPRIGYRNPEALRGMHPAGAREVLVHTPSQLDGLKGVLLRIASTVGARKRKLVEEKAKALNLTIVNARQDGRAGKEKAGARRPKQETRSQPAEGRGGQKKAEKAVPPNAPEPPPLPVMRK